MKQNQKAFDPSGPVTAKKTKQNEAEFTPSPDEVARKAYFTYLNQGALPGYNVQHWLEAEAELLAERNLNHALAASPPNPKVPAKPKLKKTS